MLSQVLTNVAVVLVVVVLLGFYVSWRATRLDRLHTRVETTRAALDAALVRRSAVALELAASGLLDPATSVLLAGAAHDARAGSDERRELAESDLSRALRAAFDQPDLAAILAAREGADVLVSELEAAAHQVFLARRFYNEAVSATRAARRRRLVRWLRLAGDAPLPAFFEIDDAGPRSSEDGPGDMSRLTP